MRIKFDLALAVTAALLLLPSLSVHAGFTGNRGGARPQSRPAARPASRPSVPNLGGSRPAARPSTSRPSISKPAISRPTQPSISRPSASRPSIPTRRPTTPSINRPTVSRPSTSRPTVDLPSVNRPSGGLKPSTRPSTQLPSTGIASRPTTRPSIERPSVSLPTTRPATRPETRPSTRPSIPSLGGGGSGNRPNINLPGGGNRPGSNLPNRPGGGRPSPGDIGDFLGLDRPVTLPAEIGNRPGGGNRPGINLPDLGGGGNRPGINLPNRPGGGTGIDWPSLGDKVNIGDINIGNNVINNRPSWVNIDNERITNIGNRWGNQIGGIQGWDRRHPDRVSHWRHWGDDVRHHWGHYHDHHHWFQPDWWYGHNHGFGGWHYYHGFQNHSWRYWWTVPTYASCVNWFSWTAPATVWNQPIYYDYGQGGNVVYENNVVYVNGEQVATADDFAQSAAALATVPPPDDEEQAGAVEWMPLGTFAVASDEKDVDPSRVVQLAVSKEGIISGTLYNTQTDRADSVQGQVDKETQRVAFRVGESEDIIVETGLYNLTQSEAPLLVHFGPEKVEDWLLVRLENPETEKN